MIFTSSPEHAAARLVVALLGDALKANRTTDAIAREYTRRLTALVSSVLDGEMRRARAAREHRALISDIAERAYIAGLAVGGVDEPDLSRDERREIAAWIREQHSHVDGFWLAVAELRRARQTLSRRGYANERRRLMDRVTLWEHALRALIGLALAAAQRNMMVTWRYGDTSHCDTCARLHGQRHRLRWFTSRGYIPQQPGSTTLQCGGWRCRCTLVDDRGKVVLPA